MKRMVIGLGMLLLVLVAAPVYAATPLETVRTEVNKVLEVLRNKGLKEEAKREKLRVVYQEMFDQVELSRWSLGRNWNKLTEAQRQEFLSLFQQVLEKTYADKILAYTDEKILFDREVPISKGRVEVQTRVVTQVEGSPHQLQGRPEKRRHVEGLRRRRGEREPGDELSLAVQRHPLQEQAGAVARDPAEKGKGSETDR